MTSWVAIDADVTRAAGAGKRATRALRGVTETVARRNRSMRVTAALTVCLVAIAGLALVACGSGDGEEDGREAAPGPEGAGLTVTVQPKGADGPAKRIRIECERLGEGSETCRRLAGLTAKRIAPVPPTTACAQIFGGPARARVAGELRGERIDARFSRADACEIKRWDDNAALLDPE